jgi:type I restriction enzyme S subunit
MGYAGCASSNEDLLVIGRVGAYCGVVHVARAPLWVTDNALFSAQWLTDTCLEFLAEQLRRYNLNQLKRKAAQPLITQSILDGLKIAIPERTEQSEVADVLRAAAGKLGSLDREIALLGELFRAMLEELMTGRLSAVPLIEQEAAS